MSSQDDDEAFLSIDPAVVKSDFCSRAAKKSLRITCYGSSSEKTPEKYLREARSLGYILAKRGHVCVNGAGSFGCMAAMNDGAMAGNGHIVGVIHEMFLIDGGYWKERPIDRDGGAHRAFSSVSDSSTSQERDGPIREILVAGGDDLQRRKKLLVDKAEAILVLPGGPGTWDELWEMACSRHLGLVALPIVCVNVDDYYSPFIDMLERAYEDKLIKLLPHQIVHFAPTAEQAVRWIEEQKEGKEMKTFNPKLMRRSSTFKRSSFFSPPLIFSSDEGVSFDETTADTVSIWSQVAVTFAVGVLCGLSIGLTYARR